MNDVISVIILCPLFIATFFSEIPIWNIARPLTANCKKPQKPLSLRGLSTVFAFNDSLNDVAPAFPILLSIIHKEKEWQMNDTHVHSIVLTTKIKCNKRWICHQWFTECWSSHVSNLVNYWFGATENNNRLVSFPPYSPPRVSLNSAEFSFSPSLNNAAPMSPILFPVIVKWRKHFMF